MSCLNEFWKTKSICHHCGITVQNPTVVLCEDKFSPVGPFSSRHRNPFLFLHVIVNVSQNRCAGHRVTVGPLCPWTALFTSVTAILLYTHRTEVSEKDPTWKKNKKNLLLWKLLPLFLFCYLIGSCLCYCVTHCSNGRQCPPMQICCPVSGVTFCTAQPILNRRFYDTSTHSLLVLKCSLPLKYS